MNKKLDDLLLQLAFGELSSEDAARLESRISGDPEAEKALRMYRAMKGEFKTLIPIVPDQLSRERLREAVLSRGLEPVRSPWRPWLVAGPASVLACVALFVVTRPMSHEQPKSGLVALSTAGPANDIRSDFAQMPSTVANAKSGVTPTGDSSRFLNSSKRVATASPTQSSSLVSRKSSRITQPTEGDIAKASDPNLRLASMELSKHASLVVPMAKREPAQKHQPAPSTETQLVLIDNDQDQDTGALRATEMESNANVSVGG